MEFNMITQGTDELGISGKQLNVEIKDDDDDQDGDARD